MKFIHFLAYLFFTTAFLSSCIGEDIIDDFVESEIRISTNLDSLEKGSTFQFEAMYFNNVGQIETAAIEWVSSPNTILSISSTGLATGLEEGTAMITASITKEDGTIIKDETSVHIGSSTVIAEPTARTGTIATTSTYTLEGDFTLSEQEDGTLLLEFKENYKASSNLPGLYFYLTNNPSTTASAYEIGPAGSHNGAHSYTITGVDINTYSHVLGFCKPFNVKVGDGELSE